MPEVSAKLKEPNAKERKFEEMVKSAEQAVVLVLALEAGLGVMLLGWLFERFDVSTEQTA